VQQRAKLSIGRSGISFRVLDIFSIALAIGVATLFSLHAYSAGAGPGEVSVQADGKDYLYPLDRNVEFMVSGPIGETTIQIRNNSVRIADSPCRDKICVAAGWLSHNGQWTACLPNRVFVRVEGGSTAAVDAQTF